MIRAISSGNEYHLRLNHLGKKVRKMCQASWENAGDYPYIQFVEPRTPTPDT
jgi:hypothetical protein